MDTEEIDNTLLLPTTYAVGRKVVFSVVSVRQLTGEGGGGGVHIL